MLRARSKTGLILALAYFWLFLMCAVYGITVMVRDTLHSEMAGIYALILALPWSILLAAASPWYDRFASTPWLYGSLAMLTFAPGALVNAGILYFIGRLFDDAFRKGTLASGDAKVFVPEQSGKIWKNFNLFFWPFFLIRLAELATAFMSGPQVSHAISVFIALRIIGTVGEIVVLSYFGYALTRQKPYLFLGAVVLFPFISLMGLAGYIVLWLSRMKQTRNSRGA